MLHSENEYVLTNNYTKVIIFFSNYGGVKDRGAN